MALQLNHLRGRQALALGAISLGLLVAAFFVSRTDQAVYAARPGGVLAAPGIDAPGVQTRVISITSRQGVFSLVRTPRGWSLQDRGGYPVGADRVRVVEAAFKALRLMRPITRDSAKHGRLNVGDPAAGGDGVLVQLQDERGAFLVDLILGYRDESVYVRKRGDTQVWTVSGDLPALRDASFWLELAPFGLSITDLQRLDIAAPTGPGFTILRPEPGADFTLGRPFSALVITQKAALASMLSVIAKVQPRDVAPAPSLGGVPMARLLATASDGVIVAMDVHRKDGVDWLKATARTAPGATSEAQARAQQINAQTGAWAFRLSPEDSLALTPALAALVGEEAVTRHLSVIAPVPRPRPIVQDSSTASAAPAQSPPAPPPEPTAGPP